MGNSDAIYVGTRADALARVILTRRDDLIIAPAQERGLDLFVELVKAARPTRRVFGVRVKGTTEDLLTEADADAFLASQKPKRSGVAPTSFPVCLFLFAMARDTSFYAWVSEPVLPNGRGPKLQPRREWECRRLDGRAIDEIITRVDRWYDAIQSLLKP